MYIQYCPQGPFSRVVWDCYMSDSSDPEQIKDSQSSHFLAGVVQVKLMTWQLVTKALLRAQIEVWYLSLQVLFNAVFLKEFLEISAIPNVIKC